MNINMSNDNIFIAIICGTIALTIGSIFFRTKKLEAESQTADRKNELVKEYLNKPDNSKIEGTENPTEGVNLSIGDQINHEGIEGIETVNSSIGDKIDPSELCSESTLQIKELGDSLCQADQVCKNLLDFAQTMETFLQINDSFLFMGALPALALALSVRTFPGLSDDVNKRKANLDNSLSDDVNKRKDNATLDNNARLFLRENARQSRSLIKDHLELCVVERMKNGSAHNQLLMKEQMSQVFAKSGLSEQRWVQVLLAALNWNNFTISSPFTVFGFIDRNTLTHFEKGLAKWIVEKGKLVLDKQYNPLLHAYKGEGHKAR